MSTGSFSRRLNSYERALILTAMDEMDFTQVTLAEKANTSPSSISRKISGGNIYDYEAAAIYEALGSDPKLIFLEDLSVDPDVANLTSEADREWTRLFRLHYNALLDVYLKQDYVKRGDILKRLELLIRDCSGE